MGAETVGGHIVRSLEKSLARPTEVEKKGKGAVNMDKAADDLMAELDRLVALLGNDKPEDA